MAKIENLKTRVQKSQETVEKRKATIARHEKQLVKKIGTLETKSGRTIDIQNMDSYKWDENGKSYDYYWEACDVCSKLDDIKGAKKKLAEAERVLGNWIEKLDAEMEKEDFINNDVPQVIKDFLEAWKVMAYEWHVKRFNDYQVFKQRLDEEEKEAKAELGIEKHRFPTRAQEKVLKEKELDWKSIQARKANFAGGTILYMDSIYKEEERLAWLDKTLEADKKAKTIDLINRINHVVGAITDASNLKVSNAGNLNGVITGTKGKAKVETVGAGGWNIQCFHYRTLVHEVK